MCVVYCVYMYVDKDKLICMPKLEVVKIVMVTLVTGHTSHGHGIVTGHTSHGHGIVTGHTSHGHGIVTGHTSHGHGIVTGHTFTNPSEGNGPLYK